MKFKEYTESKVLSLDDPSIKSIKGFVRNVVRKPDERGFEQFIRQHGDNAIKFLKKLDPVLSKMSHQEQSSFGSGVGPGFIMPINKYKIDQSMLMKFLDSVNAIDLS